MVGLLEEDVGAYLGLLEHAVLIDRGRRDVHVDASDGAISVLDGVDRLHALEYVLDGAHDGILPRFDGEALVTHVLQGDDLLANLVLGELAASYVTVLGVVGAIQASVDAVVREIERGKEHDAVAVVGKLDLTGESLDPLIDLWDVTGKEHGRIAMREHAAVVARGVEVGLCLVKDLVNEPQVMLMLIREGKRI